MGANKIVEIFFHCVNKLNSIGFIVKTCITDQGSNFMQFCKILNITKENPFLKINNNTIYFFYDSPHLMKSVRNNLSKYNIHHKMQNRPSDFGVAKWEHIVQLYKNDLERKYKYVPKLTKKCIQLPDFSRMKVSTAIHTFSHSTAAGIEAYITINLMNNESFATAEFCEQMNTLFDVFNSYSLTGPIEMRRAITPNSSHMECLEKLKVWIVVEIL